MKKLICNLFLLFLFAYSNMDFFPCYPKNEADGFGTCLVLEGENYFLENVNGEELQIFITPDILRLYYQSSEIYSFM